MNKFFSIALFFISLVAFSENVNDTIVVKMQPATYTQVVLYNAEGAQQKYVSHSESKDGIFKLAIPSTAPHAAYRLVFNQKTMDYIDFLYVGKSFQITFNPDNQNELPTFISSEENSRYFKHLFAINGMQQKLDSIQILFFKTKDANQWSTLRNQYDIKQKELKTTIENIENTETNSLIKDVLKANERVLPTAPMVNPTDYLSFIKQHFFDHINFDNQNLIHSSILVDKVMDYVFYLSATQNPEDQNELYKNTVMEVLNKITEDSIRKGFIQALIQSFAQDENIVLVDFLFENYYDKLPLEIQNHQWKNGLQQEMNTAVGRVAPDFEFSYNNKPSKLLKLSGYKYYIVVFWSTSCSHCLKEVPMFYDYIKDRQDTQVIAVGMETAESKPLWEKEISDYAHFINVFGIGKWENPITKSYNVHATPEYFILDEHKKIISKPYDFEAVEAFFNDIKY